MKKKFITMAGAMMLVVAMATSAMAVTPSAQGSVKPTVEGTVTASNGTTVSKDDVKINDSSVTVDLKATGVSGLVTDVTNAAVHSVFDVSLPADVYAAVFANGGTLSIPFTLDGIAGKTVKVLHFNGTAWEVVPSTVSGNVVTATFTSLSPVAVVVGDASTGDKQSQAWGMGYETIAVTGMALCAVVFFFSVKKARA